MKLSGILFYVSRAAKFSLAVCGIYAAVRAAFLAAKGRRPDWKRELFNLLFVGYFAALTEIIALRGGPGNARELHPVPLRTTLRTLKEGLWPFVYNFVGNVVWFVPLGMFLHRKGILRAGMIGAAVSLSLEILQWLLMTGVTDIDDVIINAMGAMAGAFLWKILNKMRGRCV